MGADSGIPFKRDDITLVCAKIHPTHNETDTFSVGNFKIPSDGTYKVSFASKCDYWSSATVIIGDDTVLDIPTYNTYTGGIYFLEEQRECIADEEISITTQVIVGTLFVLVYKVT